MKMFKLTFVIAITAFLTACSKGGLLSLERAPNAILQEGTTGAEFSSSAAAYETTLTNGYHVQQSVGDMVPELIQTSGGGYKLYSTVEGQILSGSN